MTNTIDTSRDLFNILDSIDMTFLRTTFGWITESEKYGRRLLISLAVIDIILVGIKSASKEQSYRGIFNELIKKIIFIAAFITLFKFLPSLSEPGSGFFSWFETLGSRITGVSRLSPTGIIDSGLQIITTVLSRLNYMPMTALVEGMIYVVAIAVLFYCFALVACELLNTKLLAYIVMYGGCVFLALAGSGFTKKYATSYLALCFSIGVRLFIAYLVVAVGIGISDAVISKLTLGFTGDYQAVYLAVMIFVIYANVAKNIGSIANGFVSGSVSSSSDNALLTAVAAAGMAAMYNPKAAAANLGSIASTVAQFAAKGVGHAQAAMETFGKNLSQNKAGGSSTKTAAPKAALQTLGTAAKNIGGAIGDKAAGVYRSHQANVQNSPFSTGNMPPPPSTSQGGEK